jgi:hypothetical protein
MAAGDLLQKYAVKAAIGAAALASLANAAAMQTDVVDNTATGYIDAVIRVTITSSATTNTGLIDVYVYASLDDTSYIDGATGANGTFTAANRRNAKYIGSIQANPAVAGVAVGIFSVAWAFDGVLPERFGLIIINNSAAALNATGNSVDYSGVYVNAA